MFCCPRLLLLAMKSVATVGGRPDERGAPGCGEVDGRHLIEAAEVRHPPQVVQQPEQRVAVQGGHRPQRRPHPPRLLAAP